MTAQELKNSILQMAVQGKLVPQDPSDEPASVLLERIRAEKERLIREGKIKRDKAPSVIFRGADNTPYEKAGDKEPVSIADEVPFEIPDTWEWVRLGMISTYAQSKNKVNAKEADPDTWALDLEDIEKGGRLIVKLRVHQRKAVGDKTRFEKGDILYSKLRPYLLKVLIADEDGICTPEIVPFKVYGGICAEYMVAYLQSPYVDRTINAVTYGVKMPRAGTETMVSLLVPLPPVEEQRRIVGKIRELLPIIAQYDAVERSQVSLNEEFPGLLRKSILQLAVQGKLVPQDPSDEPASVLLERIRAEKERLIAAGKIKRDKHESVIFRRDNSHYEKRGKTEVCIDSDLPFDIPDSWSWIRLANVIEDTDAGKSPQCESRPREDDEWGVIKTTAIQEGFFLPEENKVLPNSFEVQESQVVHQWDLLITRAGPKNRTGILCVVDMHVNRLILSDKTVRIRYMGGYINPKYLMLALLSPWGQHVIGEAMTGMAESQVNISQEKMKSFLLPLPPYQEQNRIVKHTRKVLQALQLLTP